MGVTDNKKQISIKIDVDDLDYLKTHCTKYQRQIQKLIKDWIRQDSEKDTSVDEIFKSMPQR